MTASCCLTLSYWGGGGGGVLFFLYHPQHPQAIKLKLSDFKDTSLEHILQIPVRHSLSCYYGNETTNDTSQNLAPWKSEIFE